ncbi:putative Prephenate dehydrogenase [[Clostridium] ultunense Esp]|nr:putative Prephenate dehydrogenase [[Clostridium] ultunense Esp]
MGLRSRGTASNEGIGAWYHRSGGRFPRGGRGRGRLGCPGHSHRHHTGTAQNPKRLSLKTRHDHHRCGQHEIFHRLPGVGGIKRHEVTFIGGHPMAGSHKSGVEAANPLLFENAFYVLSPTEKTPEEKVKELEELLAPTRAQFIYLDPKLHDQVVGMISHFPHLVAGLLVNQVERLHGENPWYHRLAAGGFKDITRIASSNPDLWRDVTLDNRENLLRIIDSWNRDMEVLKESLIQEDGERIRAFFERAALFRNGLPERNAGALRPLNDLYLDIPDRPGEIGKITTLIGEMGINLINIEILELREDIMGVLRLSFRNGADRDRVRDRLAKLGYTLYQRE